MKVVTLLFLISLSWNDITAPQTFENITFLSATIFCLTVWLRVCLILAVRHSLPLPSVGLGLTLTLALLILALSGALLNDQGAIMRLFVYAIPFLITFSVVLLSASSKIGIESLTSGIGLGVFLSAYIVAGEFVARYFLDLEILQFLPRNRSELMATVELSDQRVVRARGLSSEPGFLAFYFNCLGPIAAYALLQSRLSFTTKITSLIALLIAMTSLFSPTPIFALVASALVFLMKPSRRKLILSNGILIHTESRGIQKRNRRQIYISVFLLISIVLVLIYSDIDPFQRQFAAATAYIQGFAEGPISMRHQALSAAMLLYSSSTSVMNYMLGWGPGVFDNPTIWSFPFSPINSYLIVTIELGLFGLTIFLTMIAYFFNLAIRSQAPLSPYVAIGILAGALHCFVIGVFHQIFFPLLFGIALLLEKSK